MLLDTRPSSESLAPRGLSEVLWKMDVTRDPDGRATEVLFTHGPGTGVVFTKRVWTEPGTWRIYLEFGLQNVSAGPSRRMELNFTPAGCVPEELGDRFYQEPDAVAAGRGREGTELSIDTEAAPGLDYFSVEGDELLEMAEDSVGAEEPEEPAAEEGLQEEVGDAPMEEKKALS